MGSHFCCVLAVRFGKYTGMRSTDRHVHITVNGELLPCQLQASLTALCLCAIRLQQLAKLTVDVQADVTMHLGRSGEAYFVGEDAIEGQAVLLL